ncbi:hypothetical protein A4E84_38720 [Streptomyces qaidamensis]|uniref:Uncharacterized protein n=1 Tax=Streptomyces qaidamensis TaxID=1783515 RepID=A0A143CBP8_9ACTN|nr:hypothetical protein [Streptomyces qaidamensis]AMW14877.1 hypothetical protein A4E84_38720 [Streptomyces qaidamensis]
MDYDSVADELYALRPEEFTAARASAVASARTAGDRELAERIGALRKPSLAAWVSNLLVRGSPGEVEPLLRLGEGLRQAHQDLDGAQLRELSRRQHALIRALSLQARQLAKEAGHPIGEGAQRDVENTLHAVLADPEAARAWAGGRLTKPLNAAVGFPAVAEGARPQRPAPAPAPSRPDKKTSEQQRRRLERARKEADAVERELRELRDEAAVAGRAAGEAKQQVDALQRRVEELTGELERIRGEHQQARFAERTARERARTADRRVREADRKAATAAARLERLTSSDA